MHKKLHKIPQKTTQIFTDFYALQKISQILAEIFAIAKISAKVFANFCAYICGNIYTAKIEKNDSSKEIGKTTINVSYTGPYVQYSNTIQGYETGDWFYGLRLFYIYSNSLDSNSYNTIESNDTFIIDYNNIINNFIKENNPNNAFGINITFGWRL